MLEGSKRARRRTKEKRGLVVSGYCRPDALDPKWRQADPFPLDKPTLTRSHRCSGHRCARDIYAIPIFCWDSVGKRQGTFNQESG